MREDDVPAIQAASTDAKAALHRGRPMFLNTVVEREAAAVAALAAFYYGQ